MLVDLCVFPYNKRGGYSVGDEALGVELCNYYDIRFIGRPCPPYVGERRIIGGPDAFLAEFFTQGNGLKARHPVYY